MKLRREMVKKLKGFIVNKKYGGVLHGSEVKVNGEIDENDINVFNCYLNRELEEFSVVIYMIGKYRVDIR